MTTELSQYFQKQDGTVAERKIRYRVPPGVRQRTYNLENVTRAYTDRGSVAGPELPQEKLLSPANLIRAKNRAEFVLAEDSPQKLTLAQRIKSLFTQ